MFQNPGFEVFSILANTMCLYICVIDATICLCGQVHLMHEQSTIVSPFNDKMMKMMRNKGRKLYHKFRFFFFFQVCAIMRNMDVVCWLLLRGRYHEKRNVNIVRFGYFCYECLKIKGAVNLFF